ncbi:MAG: glycosyltransferase [Stellaceae bacterium]
MRDESAAPLGSPARPIRIATFGNLYPNAVQPAHGIFVENRLRHLLGSGLVESRVIAPVFWFPPALSPIFKGYVHYGQIPRREQRHGIEVLHPRYLVLPKIGMSLGAATLFARALPVFRRLRKERDFDLIDAHYFYPDGVAAALIGAVLHKPVVITARGSDLTELSRYALPRSMVRFAVRSAAGLIAVSRALKDELVHLGAPASKVRVLRNGVDLSLFRPLARAAARAAFGFEGSTLLSVGRLVGLKGYDLVIGALTRMPRHSLAIAGEGPERASLERLAQSLGVNERVRFLGSVPHERLAALYSAADILVLASSREGWPNVLLEAMACGTPVVVSNIAGMSEIVTDAVGAFMPERTAGGVAAAVAEIERIAPSRMSIRRYAEHFSWDETTLGQLRLFSEILGAAPPVPAPHDIPACAV